jgi:hypothetical protein
VLLATAPSQVQPAGSEEEGEIEGVETEFEKSFPIV